MARPPKYATAEEKPVSVTFRIPRALYDQGQQHARQRRTTLTELVCEGLQMRLETPTDPRDILATQDITVMQELRQMIADEVQAALATQRSHAGKPAPTEALKPGTGPGWITYKPSKDLKETLVEIATGTYRLGKLCNRGHDFQSRGRSLRRLSDDQCVECCTEQEQSSQAPVAAPKQKPTSKSKSVHSRNAETRFQDKLTPEQKAEVCGKYAAGAPPEALMEEYGISRATLFRYLQDAETRPARKRQRPRGSAA
jgi:hypothetical protein